jgi:hypothetical protein
VGWRHLAGNRGGCVVNHTLRSRQVGFFSGLMGPVVGSRAAWPEDQEASLMGARAANRSGRAVVFHFRQNNIYGSRRVY